MGRGTRSEDFQLTASQREILWQLREYRVLTPRLLALAYGAKPAREGRGYWHILRQVRILSDVGLVARLRSMKIHSGGGSDEFAYKLSEQGARAILAGDDLARERRQLRMEGRREQAHVDHSVAVSTLQLILTLGQCGWRLLEFRRDERGARVHGASTSSGHELTAWPDASAVIEHADTSGGESLERTRFLFEMDLARKSNQRIRDRFEAYLKYLFDDRGNRGARADHERGGLHGSTIAVFVVPNEREVERLMELAVDTTRRGCLAGHTGLLLWNTEDWYVQSGGDSETEIAVGAAMPAAASKLRSPQSILSEASLSTIEGEARRLVQAGSGSR